MKRIRKSKHLSDFVPAENEFGNFTTTDGKIYHKDLQSGVIRKTELVGKKYTPPPRNEGRPTKKDLGIKETK